MTFLDAFAVLSMIVHWSDLMWVFMFSFLDGIRSLPTWDLKSVRLMTNWWPISKGGNRCVSLFIGVYKEGEQGQAVGALYAVSYLFCIICHSFLSFELFIVELAYFALFLYHLRSLFSLYSFVWCLATCNSLKVFVEKLTV